MERIVEPEILDSLPACHVDAAASRRDLRTINRVMGNFRWIRAQMKAGSPEGERHIMELGAGDGALARRLTASFRPASYTAIDRAPQPEAWPETAQWRRIDCKQLEDFGPATELVANLFLHHLQAAELAQLGRRIQSSQICRIIAAEPCRRRIHQWQLRAGRLIGFNPVTLMDGWTSVRAGFRGDELPELLALCPDRWTWSARETCCGAYRLRADRR